MPGIAGLVSARPAASCREDVARMVASMAREPFYLAGATDCEQAGVYLGWTAHAGSYAASISSRSRGDVVAVVAGECLVDGHEADICALYAAHGDAFVARLNGLFSGCVIDRPRRRVLLFNDRYGLERIYAHECADGFYFASESKALLQVLPGTRELDRRGVTQFLAYGCTAAPTTLFRDVELVQGGTLWTFDGGGRRRIRYFEPTTWEQQAPLTADGFASELYDNLARAVPECLQGTSEIGLSLTGGLDTRMIAACLPGDVRHLRSYTFAGELATMLDERIARRIAASCGLPHDVLRVGEAFLRDYPRQVDRTVVATDGTFGATGAHEIYLNGLARGLAPVRLTGNFGSEVLRGMSTFKPQRLASQMFSAETARDVDGASRRSPLDFAHPVTRAVFGEVAYGLFPSLAAGRSQVTFRTPFLDNDLVALAYRAPEAERHSTRASLDAVRRGNPTLSRIPTDRGVLLNDWRPARWARRVFAEVTFKLDYLHKDGLPGWLMPIEPAFTAAAHVGLIGLHKYLPYRNWFRTAVVGHVREVVTDPRTLQSPWWNAAELPAMLEAHVAGRQNYVRELNAVLTLEAIERLLLKPQPIAAREVIATS